MTHGTIFEHGASLIGRERYRTLCHRKLPRTGGDGVTMHPSRCRALVTIAHSRKVEGDDMWARAILRCASLQRGPAPAWLLDRIDIGQLLSWPSPFCEDQPPTVRRLTKLARVFQRLGSLRTGWHRPRFLKRINRFGVQTTVVAHQIGCDGHDVSLIEPGAVKGADVEAG